MVGEATERGFASLRGEVMMRLMCVCKEAQLQWPSAIQDKLRTVRRTLL